MYPTISAMLNDLLGIHIPLPIQTFGFFMGLSFLGAYYTTMLELKRKESLGLVQSFTKKITVNKPLSNTDMAIQIIVGALIGYKLLEMILHYNDLLLDTQGFVLSARGNWLGALLGGVVAWYLQYTEAKKLKGKTIEEKNITVHPYELMGNILLIAAISGLLGAKIFHNLENLDDFATDPIGALLSFSGLTFYGGLIVASYAVLRYTNKHGIYWKHMVDAAAPGLILAYGIGRIGCHLSGDGDWGIVNELPKPEWMASLPNWLWAYTYPHNVLGEGIPIMGCEGMHCAVLPQAVFPTPLYEAIMSLSIFGLLWALRTRIYIPAMMFSIYLVLNGVERFLIEKIRVNTTYTIFGKHITQAELISAALILVGLVGIIYLWNQHSNKRKKEAL
jgi:phosphatidylglycerol---prolipoprotein diacylglyceryl transferase